MGVLGMVKADSSATSENARRLPRGARIVVATHNAGKLIELRELLAPFGLELVSAGELGLPEPDETGHMFAENAAIKAHAAAPHMLAHGQRTRELVAQRAIHILQPA